MALEKVRIDLLDTAVPGGTGGTTRTLHAAFNPTEYTLNKGAQIAEINIPGLDSPILQFVHGQNEKLSLDLFFDTTDSGMGEQATDVRQLTGPFYQLVKIQPTTHAPPRVRVSWASLSFVAIVESVQQKFTLFNPQGVPLRATLTVSLREYKTLAEQLQQLNLQSADHTKQHVVKRGETLSQIAASEYDDPRKWRHIARFNGIVNPRRLVPGMVLYLPPVDVFGRFE